VPIETVPIHRAQWTDLVLRMRIPSRRKTVAFALAKFANADGSRVFPGQGKVADMAGLHETNARTHIRALVSVGMLTVVKRGGGRGGATTTYRLSRGRRTSPRCHSGSTRR
jgi:predicted ArsR family transcriptional regulator